MKIFDKLKEKDFAIKLLGGFFAIMFVLTLLSRMADSITIPNVKVSSPRNSSITHEVELTGTLEAKHETNIEVSSGFTIKKVHTKKGDQVKKGDLLMTLDTKELEDKLLQAEMELQKLDIQAQQLALDMPIPDHKNPILEAEHTLKRIEEDRVGKTGQESEKIQRAKEDLKLAEEDLRLGKQKLDLLTNKNQEGQLKKAQEAVTAAKKELENKQYERDKALKSAQMDIDNSYEDLSNFTTGSSHTVNQALQRARAQYKIVENDWKRIIKDHEEELKKAEETLKKVENGEIDKEMIDAEEQNIQTAQRNLDAKKRYLEDTQKGKDNELQSIDRLIEDAQIQLEKVKNEELTGQLTKENQELKAKLQKSLLDIDKAVKVRELNDLKAIQTNGGVIESPIDGIVLEVKAEEGNQTTGANLITMIAEEGSYEFVATINEEEEEYVKIGDEVRITLQGEDRPLEGTIVDNIISVPGEDGSKRQVYVTLPKGEPGISAKMNIMKETEKYSSVLPVGALREDQVGQYVLVVGEKNTTLGEELVIERVEVQVIDRNQTLVAVKSGLAPNDKVVVESNKTIMVGDRIRLKE